MLTKEGESSATAWSVRCVRCFYPSLVPSGATDRHQHNVSVTYDIVRALWRLLELEAMIRCGEKGEALGKSTQHRIEAHGITGVPIVPRVGVYTFHSA